MRFIAERIESSFCRRVREIFKSLTVNIHFLIWNVYGALWEEFEGAVDVCCRNQNLLVLYLTIMMMMFVLGVSFTNARYFYQMLLFSSLPSSSYYCVCYFVFTPLLYLLFCLHSKSESDICLWFCLIASVEFPKWIVCGFLHGKYDTSVRFSWTECIF